MVARKRPLYYGRDQISEQDAIKRIDAYLSAVREEYLRAREIHPVTPNGHSGYAVLLEEVEEVWQEVKHPTQYENLFKECVQVSAMALAMALELK